MAKKISIEEWVRDALTDPDQDAPCSAIALMHDVDGNRKEILTKKFGSKEGGPERIARLFTGRMESCAAALAGQQVFWLYAFYGATEPGNTHPFPLMGTLAYDDYSSEEPNRKGQAQQEMRLKESWMGFSLKAIEGANRDTREAAQVVAGIAKQQLAMFSQLMEENSRARDRHMQYEQEAFEREQSKAMELAKYNRDTQLMASGLKALGPLANVLTGRELVPQSTVNTAIVEGLFEAVPEDAFQYLIGNLPKEQQAIIIDQKTKWMIAKRKAAEELAGVEKQASEELIIVPEFGGKAAE
jgi:hypothetical protein